MNFNGMVQRWMSAVLDSDRVEPAPMPQLPDVVEQARQEWLSAQHYYNTVSDQDLIDHAVYMMQAAEKKYMYLLKQARQQGITYSPYTVGQQEMHNQTNV